MALSFAHFFAYSNLYRAKSLSNNQNLSLLRNVYIKHCSFLGWKRLSFLVYFEIVLKSYIWFELLQQR